MIYQQRHEMFLFFLSFGRSFIKRLAGLGIFSTKQNMSSVHSLISRLAIFPIELIGMVQEFSYFKRPRKFVDVSSVIEKQLLFT